jgi:hypothetical protein
VTFNGGQSEVPLDAARIEAWARELGFSQIGVAGVDLSSPLLVPNAAFGNDRRTMPRCEIACRLRRR